MRIAWRTGALLVLGVLLNHGKVYAAAGGQSGTSASATQPSQHSLPDSARQATQLTQDLQALERLEADFLRAEMENSARLAGAVLADDYLGVRADGTMIGKEDVLNSLSRHERARTAYVIRETDMKEHVFGDTACVTYIKTYTLPETHASYSEMLMHIFTKRLGVWLLQVSSPVPRPKLEPPAILIPAL